MAHQIYIQEAIRLTGKSRRTLYRDMDAGHLSYHKDARNRRYFDVAELIRVYGELEGMESEATAEPQEAPTLPALPGHDLQRLIEAAVNQAVAAAVEPLVEELRRLRQYQAEHLEAIEHDIKRLPAPDSGPHSARARGELIAQQGPVDDPHGLHALVRAMREKDEWDASDGEVH